MHVGETASALTRPENVFLAKPPVDSLETSFDAETPDGPASTQPVVFFFGAIALMRAAARAAACVCAGAIASAGYAWFE